MDWINLKGINQPEGGWEDNTWYLIEVKMKSNNPPHKHLYYTGFQNKGYSGGFPINYVPDELTSLRGYYYVKVLKKLDI